MSNGKATIILYKDWYNAKVKNIEEKILDITNVATSTTLNAKINEVKGKIPIITNLATTIAVTVAENKIPNVSNLVKKPDYDTKISKIENKITIDRNHDKVITTQKFSLLAAQHFASRLAQANLANKSDIANFVKMADFENKLQQLNENVSSNKTKHALVQNKLMNYQKKSKQYQLKD